MPSTHKDSQMFGNAFGWPHLIVLLVIILLLFGAPRLPALARSLGQSMKIFRNEIKNPDSGTPDASADKVQSADVETKPKQ